MVAKTSLRIDHKVTRRQMPQSQTSEQRSEQPSVSLRVLAARWPRVLLDVGWCLAFGVLLALVLLRAPSGAFLGASGEVKLVLVEGVQRQILLKDGRELGTVVSRVERHNQGWRVSHRFILDGQDAGRTVLDLRADLSLDALELDVDMERMGQLSGLPQVVRAGLRGLKQVKLRGKCSVETGDCQVRGKLGPHPLQQSVSAGRGPVVTAAIYPLLAQGSLGGRAEVRIFDPLSLSQRLVTFQVEGRERLRLRSGTYDTIRVLRDLEGLATRVWIDRRGRVIKEQLPLGVVVEHEAWDEE